MTDESPEAPAGLTNDETAAPADNEMSAGELREAQRYGRQQLAFELADKGLDLLFLGAMAFVLAKPIGEWLQTWTASPTLALAALYVITMLLHECVSLPLSFSAGHVLETRYGLSNQTASAWLSRHFKHFALAVAIGLPMFLGLFALIWFVGAYWWIVAAAAFFVVSVVLAQLGPVLIMPLFHKIEPLENDELGDRMARLSDGTGLTIEGVYRMAMSEETKKVNAMLAGVGGTRRVIMGDTLLEQFSPDEIEVIFAHEIGHHVFRHIRKLILGGAVFSLVGFFVCDRAMAAWLGVSDFSATPMPFYALPALMFMLTAFAMCFEPLQNIISRRFERQCDRYALSRTQMREAYRSAYAKLAKINKADPDPNPLAVFLFHSHPPIAERLAFADE